MEPQNEPNPPSCGPSNTNSSSPMETSKISGEEDEHHQKQRNSDVILDLSLCTNDSDQGFEPELDHFNRYNVENPRNMEKTPQGSEFDHDQPRVFSCNYCQRKFYSSQALGGHQNAHKRERTLAKRGQRIGSNAFGNYHSDLFLKGRPSYPSNIAALPLHGSYNNHKIHSNTISNNSHGPLGIQAHSLIHKPSSYLTYSSNGSSCHGWSRIPMIDQQPGIGRLGLVSPSSTSSNGGVARFDSVHQRIPQALDRSTIGAISWKGSGNVLKSSSKQDYDQLHKLDLSLKL